MIAEGEILRAVEHLEHSGGGISLIVLRELVYLVEQQHGIDRTRCTHSGDYPAGHCADIRAPVTADLSLVLYAAKAHADEFPAERLGDGGGDGGLAHAGRTDEADYLPVDLAGQLRDRKMLDYPFLYLFEPVMIPVEHGARVFYVKVVAARLRKGESEHALDERAHGGHLVRARGQCRKTLYFPGNTLAHFVGELLLFQLLAEFVRLGLLAFAELGADGLYLFPQEIFLLVLVDGFPNVVLDLAGELRKLLLARHYGEQIETARRLVFLLDEGLPVLAPLHDYVGYAVRITDIVGYGLYGIDDGFYGSLSVAV